MKYYTDRVSVGLLESPMTKFVSNVIVDILLGGGSVILEYPTSFKDISLVIANSCVYNSKKTVMIITNPSTIDGLNNDYYLLSDGSVPFILRVPIGIKTESNVVAKVHFPKGAKAFSKKQYTQDYKEALENKDSILILASDTEYPNLEEDNYYFQNYKKPEILFFNNASFSSEKQIVDIINWCTKNNIQFLLLIDRLSPKFYDSINPDVFVLPFHIGMLRELAAIDETIIKGFEREQYKENAKIISKFSIDQPYHYTTESSIDYISIDNGSILIQCVREMSAIFRSLDIQSLMLKHELMQLLSIAHESIGSFIPIDKLTKYSMSIGVRINGKDFCQEIIRLSKSSVNTLKEKCILIVSLFLTIWNCLYNCKSPIFERGYTKDNKFSKLYEIIKLSINQYDRIFILPTNKQELSQLNKLIRQLFSDDISKIVITSSLNVTEEMANSSLAIFPGSPKMNELYLLNYPFRSIKVLSYHDEDYKMTRDLISLYMYIDGYRSNLFSEKLNYIVNQVPKTRDYLALVPSITKYVLKQKNEKTAEAINDVMNEINTEVVKKYPELNGYLKDIDGFKKMKKEYESELENNIVNNIKKSSSYFILTLENCYTDQCIVYYSALKTVHPFFVDNEIIESTIDETMEGKVIVKAPGNNSNLLELLLDLYGLKDKIDYEIVNIWDDCVHSFQNSDYTMPRLYDRYVELGGIKTRQTVNQWFNGNVMGPNSQDDLEIIGEILGNEDLTINADYIFEELERIRNYKRALGRKLNKIIASIIQHESFENDDPFSEMIRENVKNYLFVVKKIQKVCIDSNT